MDELTVNADRIRMYREWKKRCFCSRAGQMTVVRAEEALRRFTYLSKWLCIPCITYRTCFILAGIDEESLLQAVDTAVTMNQAGDYGIPVPDYVEENVSTKVVKIIQSYTGVVDKMVWRKF